jgi:DNA-binding GntR family transcriptional regulator
MLRREILAGRLEPGTRLLERQLAEAMGISRIPVREAIRMLESERLVVVHANRGAMVKPLGSKEIEDLFDLREALDVLEARLAAERVTPAGLELLAGFHDAATKAQAAGQVEAMHEANTRFHLQVAAMADNEALASVLEPVSTRLRWLYAQNEEPERVLKEHKSLLSAIRQGRPDKAAEVALRHVQASRRMVMGKVG